MKAESLCPFPTHPGDTFRLCTSSTFKTTRRGGLRAAQPYNAHPPWSCIWQLSSSPNYGPQPVHTSFSTPTDLLLLPFPTQYSAPSLQQHGQRVHPSQENQKWLWHEPSTSSHAFSPQADPNLSLCFRRAATQSFPAEPRLIFTRVLVP